ncbi:hypothetical protein [Aequorivita antarctica]|uniref:Lipocalin-like domain-containing protein n=1 Tax=Aequorivita antarctica TaxID=153266 RepID=A0A5C6YWL9_9FLAO|nr:hypothetical protein [Aequorivita antarctica]TXD72006.1 hypothetical protein ESU54_14660 [Aequorivita antarctica]SRX72822.1 hypothetical protein AEQU3_00520 [Aequorivita antarctica]
MKNGIYKIILIAILSLAFNSCKNDDDNNENQNLNGNYSGTFTVEYLNGDTFTNPVTVSFDGENNYQSSGDSENIPAGGSGTYEKGNSTIDFNDINIWTADFDWNLILGGEYDYLLNGNELTISANRTELGLYKYELVKE